MPRNEAPSGVRIGKRDIDSRSNHFNSSFNHFKTNARKIFWISFWLLSIRKKSLILTQTNMASQTTNPYPWKEPTSKPARGAFIVIEGLDRAGKTTQVKKLCDRLYAEGHNVKTIRFPGN